MDVDPKHHKYFIQKRGQVRLELVCLAASLYFVLVLYSHLCPCVHLLQVIKEIADENGGIIISFPKQGSGQSRVLLKGAAECIQGAKDRIKEIIEDLVCIPTPTYFLCCALLLWQPVVMVTNCYSILP